MPNSNPLIVSITPHREFLPADAPEQKLFVMLKLRPARDVAASRPSTTFTFVIDTSGSMYDDLGVGKQKIAVVLESLYALVSSSNLGESDRISLVQFDEKASTIIGLTPATKTQQLQKAIAELNNLGGSTMMGLGMRETLNLLANQTMTSRRAVILTDGYTFDEDRCAELAQQFASNDIKITVLGVGDEFNEDLLISLSDATGGKCFHVVPENATGQDIAIADLPKVLFEEFTEAQQEVINNLTLTVKTVQGVKLTRIIRAYPTQAEFPLTQEPYPIGSAVANDETVFILEFTIENRVASRVRIAQLGLTYDIPGQNRRGELPPQNLVVQFVAGQVAAQVDQEVMGYLQQCNVAQLVKQATDIADVNPQEAEKLLETARRMTIKLGNQAMSESLEDAQNELRKTKQISSGSRKTVKMGAKGKTVKMGGDINDEFSDEQIRKIAGV